MPTVAWAAVQTVQQVTIPVDASAVTSVSKSLTKPLKQDTRTLRHDTGTPQDSKVMPSVEKA